MCLYHHQPIPGVCEHSSSSFFSHQNNPGSHKHQEPPQKLLQACSAQWVSNTPVPALGAALRTGMSSLSQGHSCTQELSGGYFLVVGSRVLQHIKCYCPLLQGPAAIPDSHLPHLQPIWSNKAKHFYSSKANLVSAPKPAWCLPAFSFVYFSKFKLEESTAQLPEITQWEHE